MENNNLPRNKRRKKWFYVLLCIIACLVYFLISKEIKQKKQEAIRIQYIEENYDEAMHVGRNAKDFILNNYSAENFKFSFKKIFDTV